jgi:hypothetical protein
VKLGRSIPLLWAVAASACTCAPRPEPVAPQAVVPAQPAAPRVPGIRGRVLLAWPDAAGTRPAVEIRVVPEGAMIEFVGHRLREAREALARTAEERERAAREAKAALAENDRTDQEWKATMANDLARRIEIAVRNPSNPAEAHAVHAALLARKKASYNKAVRAARRSEAKARTAIDLEREAMRFRDARHLTQGMPAAVGATRADGSGNFEMNLPPGRYALVALPDAGTADARIQDPGWILWVDVQESGSEPLLLDERNRHGSDCDVCVVSMKELP